ncbi:hypothetical protein WDU94_008668 [Cyamophila willieti]
MGLKRCGIVDATPDPTYHLIKPCSRSKMMLVGSANTKTLQQCHRYAASKKALALNYNPTEFQEEISLAEDNVYDYYSLYGDPMPDKNVTCVPKVGMFKLHKEKMNFTAAQEVCIEEGGYLANVLNEQKTNALSSLIASVYSGRGKHLVYVGLHDSDMEGQYVNMKDEPMDCFTWRAWAPNQPRAKYKTEDCVVLTTDRNWKVVNLPRDSRGMDEPAYCELGHAPPEIPPTIPGGPVNYLPGHEEHPDNELHGIEEIPIPGVTGLNGSDTEIEDIKINNTNVSTPNKNEGKPDSNGETEVTSGKPGEDDFGYNSTGMSGKPSSNGNEYSPNPDGPDGNFESANDVNVQKPNKPQNGNIPMIGNGTHANKNKWRPIQGVHTDQGIQRPDLNWKPNTVNESPNGQNGWKPSNNIPQSGENTKRPQVEQNGNGDGMKEKPPNTWKPETPNTWRPDTQGDTLWRPNNPDTEGLSGNSRPPQSSLWIPHNGDIDENPPFEERPQNGNENGSHQKPPQTQNNNEQNEGLGHNKRPPNGWRPNNFGTQDLEKDNNWRPQTRPDSNSWRPENNGNGEPINQPSWGPQNTQNSRPHENSWIPQDVYDQQGCNEWTPDAQNRYPSDSKDQWKPVNSGANQNTRDCNKNEWVPQNRDPEDYNRDPENDNRDSQKKNINPENDNINPNYDNRDPGNYNRDPEYYNRYPGYDNKDPKIYNRDPENTDGDNQNHWISTQKEKLRNGPNTNSGHPSESNESDNKSKPNRSQEENWESKNFQQIRNFDRTIGEDRAQQQNSRFNNQQELKTRLHERTHDELKTRKRSQNIFSNEERLFTMESKKSHKKTKPPVNNEVMGGAEQNTMEVNSNMNKTKDEPKQDPVTVRIRDPDTRKCRVLTYNPN